MLTAASVKSNDENVIEKKYSGGKLTAAIESPSNIQ
jgi:hypothetical protein